MDKATRETECGHQPHKAKGLCKKCYEAAKWREKNPEPKLARVTDCGHEPHMAKGLCAKCYGAAWYQANAEKVRAGAQERRPASRELMRVWRLANPERVAAAKYRGSVQGGQRADLTWTEWRDILDEFDGHCAYCDRSDRRLEIEHMVPLACGGEHSATNVVPACRSCNRKKSKKTALEFAGWKIPPRRQYADR